MPGSLDDIGSIPRIMAEEMVQEIIRRKSPSEGITLDDCRALVREADLTELAANDLSDGEVDGLAELLFRLVSSGCRRPCRKIARMAALARLLV